ASAAAAEQIPEQVAEIAEVAEVDVEPAGSARTADASVRRSEAVVLLPLLGIGEDVVRRLDLLELLLGSRVAGVLVRVVLARELAVRLADLVLRGALLHAQGVVQGGHQSSSSSGGAGGAAATTTRAGRTTRSPSL